jgi:hypothetical protein
MLSKKNIYKCKIKIYYRVQEMVKTFVYASKVAYETPTEPKIYILKKEEPILIYLVVD